MIKKITVHNPHTRMSVTVKPSAMRRCDACKGIMYFYHSWWAAQNKCKITWRCDCQQQTKLKTVMAETTRTGELQ